MIRTFFAAILLLTIAGCQTATVPPTEPLEVSSFVYQDQDSEDDGAPKTVRVEMLRAEESPGSTVEAKFEIFDNGKKVAELLPNEKAVYYTGPGPHSIYCQSFDAQTQSDFGVNYLSEFKNDEQVELSCKQLDSGILYIEKR